MRRLNHRLAGLFGGVLLVTGPATAALADSPVEDALKGLVATIDASPDWKASYAKLAYDPATDTATMSGLTLAAETGAAKADVTTLSLAGYAPLDGGGFTAKSITIDGATFDAGPIKVALDDVALDNLTLPAMQPMAYDATKPFSSLMRFYSGVLKVKLDSGRVGSLAVLEQFSGITSRVSYEHFKIDGLANGKISAVRAGPLRMESPSPEGLVTMTVGSVESHDFDFGAFLHVYNPDEYKNGAGDMTWRTALSVATYNDFDMQVPGAEIAIRSVSLENFKMRQPKHSFTGFFDALMAQAQSGQQPELSDSDKMAAFSNVVDLVTAFGLGRFSLEGLTVKATGIDQFTLDGIHVSDLSSDGVGDFALDGLNAAVEGQGSVKIGKLAFGGLVLPSLDAIFGAMSTGDEDSADPLGLLPKLGYAEADGIDISTPDIPHLKLDNFRVDLDKYVGAVPTVVTAGVSGFDVPVAAMREDARATFAKLGYDRLATSYKIKYSWDEAKSLLSIDNLYFGVKDMGSIDASATINGITRDMIEHPLAHPDLEGEALVGAKLTFTDESIVGKGLGLLAEHMKVPPDKFRQQFADALPFLLTMSPIQDPTVMAIVRQSGLLAKLAPAVKTFVAGPGALVISLAPASPVGLGDIIGTASTAPEKLPDLLNLTLTAVPGPNAPAPQQQAPAPAQ